jgi:hypothetical protein
VRRTTSTTIRTRRPAGALVTAAIGTGVLAGCGGTAGPETGATVDEIQEEPDPGAGAGPGAGDDVMSYVGRRVTVSAEVNDVLSPNAFTIAGTAGSGGASELLIISAPSGTAVTEESVVAVTGTVQQAFDLAAVESEYGYDDDALYGDVDGEPYIVAESIDPTVAEPDGTTIEPAA